MDQWIKESIHMRTEGIVEFLCDNQDVIISARVLVGLNTGTVLLMLVFYLPRALSIYMSRKIDFVDASIQNPRTSGPVDLKWIMENITGEFIGHGHYLPKMGQSGVDDGFINPYEISGLIKKILEKKKQGDMDRKMVKELLLELDLCYIITSKEGIQKYFMPINFGGKNRIISKEISINNLSRDAELFYWQEYFGLEFNVKTKRGLDLDLEFNATTRRGSHLDTEFSATTRRGLRLDSEFNVTTRRILYLDLEFNVKQREDCIQLWVLSRYQIHLRKQMENLCVFLRILYSPDSTRRFQSTGASYRNSNQRVHDICGDRTIRRHPY